MVDTSVRLLSDKPLDASSPAASREPAVLLSDPEKMDPCAQDTSQRYPEIVYTTFPFASGGQILGSPSFAFHARSTAPDFDLFATLIDFNPTDQSSVTFCR